MYFDAAPIDRDSFPRVSGYVEQNDSHLSTSTVYEAVMFSAKLRLHASDAAREKRVDEVSGCCGDKGNDDGRDEGDTGKDADQVEREYARRRRYQRQPQIRACPFANRIVIHRLCIMSHPTRTKSV